MLGMISEINNTEELIENLFELYRMQIQIKDHHLGQLLRL